MHCHAGGALSKETQPLNPNPDFPSVHNYERPFMDASSNLVFVTRYFGSFSLASNKRALMLLLYFQT